MSAAVTARRWAWIAAACMGAALLVFVAWNVFTEARADVEPAPDPFVRVATPAPPLVGGATWSTSRGSRAVASADTSGRVRSLRRTVRAQPGDRPAVVVTGPDGAAPPLAPVVIDVPAATSGPGLFPEFSPRRARVRVSTVGAGAVADSLQAPEATASAGAPTLVVATVQPPPLIELRPTVVAGFDWGPTPVVAPDVGAWVAFSPVRVWGFRPDLAYRYQLSDGAGGFADRSSLTAGVSVEPLDRLRFRVGTPVAGEAPPVVFGLGYRFR